LCDYLDECLLDDLVNLQWLLVSDAAKIGTVSEGIPNAKFHQRIVQMMGGFQLEFGQCDLWVEGFNGFKNS
jgi:hypothetical protein